MKLRTRLTLALHRRLMLALRELRHPAERSRARSALAHTVDERAFVSADDRLERLVGITRNASAERRRAVLAQAGHSRAQLMQDLFVVSELGEKRGAGFFVEFGATNGVDLSNSWMLETRLGWKGILAEPARCWHAALRQNRSCAIDVECVWARTGERLDFDEVGAPELSTLSEFSQVDGHALARTNRKRYQVPTVSLNDLMRRYDAPAEPDYLSIDTEGSEFAILREFDFDRYRFKVITCEHNHTPMRGEIHRLLTAAGYRRKLEELSCFDDWYVRTE
jgi:FkbM family methyltransferase